MRVGQGFDAHRFQSGDHVMIGGVRIPFEQGLAAHSDGDVLLHAICDAILGALALGDIGKHFPDSSDEFHGANSRDLFTHVIGLAHKEGYRLGNVDGTIIAEQPKMAPYVDEMRRLIAEDGQVLPGQVSVKATTTEKMGFTGRGEGIAASAIVLLEKN